MDKSIKHTSIFMIIKKHYMLIVGMLLCSILVAVSINFMTVPTYESEAKLRVKPPKGLANSLLQETPSGNYAAVKQQMATYIEIAKSRDVIEAVIEKTKMPGEREVRYEEMAGKIAFQPVKDTEILKITVQAESPEKAQRIANAVAEAFNDRLIYLAHAEQRQVRGFIEERLQNSKVELEQCEQNLADYKRSNKIYAPSEETKAIVDRLYSLYKLAAENQVQAAASSARRDSTEQEIAMEKPGFVADSPLIQQYKSRLANLEIDRVSLLQKYTDKHPKVTALNEAIDEVKKNLNDEIAKVADAETPSSNPIHQGLIQSHIQAEVEVAAARAQISALAPVVNENEQRLGQLPDKELELTRLMRSTTVAQDTYIMLAKRYEEARISEFMQPSDVQMIDRASLPEYPVKPRKWINIVLAGVFGLFFGILLATIHEYWKGGKRNNADAGRIIGATLSGADINPESSFVSRRRSRRSLFSVRRMYEKYCFRSNCRSKYVEPDSPNRRRFRHGLSSGAKHWYVLC